jgi:hypothetical protein
MATADDGGERPDEERSRPVRSKPTILRRSRERREPRLGANLPRGVRKALDDYPIPSMTRRRRRRPGRDARRRLASLGYISATAAPVVRSDAPRPADMTRLIAVIERASGLFVQEKYARRSRYSSRFWPATPTISTRRCASPCRTRCSATSRRRWTPSAGPPSRSRFHRRPHYLGLHYARTNRIEQAAPLLEPVVAASPQRRGSGRRPGAGSRAAREDRRGGRAVSAGIGPAADDSGGAGSSRRAGHERAADGDGDCGVREGARDGGRPLPHDLELGVLYLSARDLDKARAALDRIPVSHPEYAMACSSAPR